MSNPTEYNRAEYIGRLVRVDIPGALDYLDACGETERADALRQRPMNPPAYDTKYAFLNPFLNAYQNYFQTCFGAGLAGAADLKAVETVACTALEQNLRELLAMPDADLEQLEDAFCHKAQAAGLECLAGKTQGYRGPYIWEQTTRADYAVELPLGIETLTLFWMAGFIMRSWLDWLTDGDAGAGGWAKPEGIYCVRKAYEKVIDQPRFQISFLIHEAQHHADLRQWDLSPGDLEYRAKLVELMHYPDATFLKSLLIEGDLGSKDNSHAWAAGKITAGLAAWMTEQSVMGGRELLEKVAQDEKTWAENRKRVQRGARALFDAHTAQVEQTNGEGIEII
jgi:hypothetical protein